MPTANLSDIDNASGGTASLGDIDPPSPSIMDPHRVRSAIKRLPSTVAKIAVGTAVPLAAGAAAGAALGPEASVPVRAVTQTAVQGLVGAAQPYIEYGMGKAMGEQPRPPEIRDALHSAAFNAGLSGLGEVLAPVKGAATVVPEMEGAPKTLAQLKQAVRNRDFWTNAGLNTAQVDSVLKLPEDEKDALANQIIAGRQTKQAFQTVVDSTRKSFKTRYDDAMTIPEGTVTRTEVTVNGRTKIVESGKRKSIADAEIEAVPIADKLVEQLQQGEHVLTPTYSNFLKNKLSDLTGIPVKTMNEIDFANSLKDPNSPFHGTAQKIWDKAEVETKTPQQLRDLRTELRENLPGQATNLDRKAAQQLNDSLTQTYEDGLRKAGATSEQIGALRAIDEDYGRFQEMLKTLDPRDEKYGSKVADALFDPMTKNPAAGAEFIALAKAADRGNPGTMDKLREAFTMRALEKSSKGATPIDQMEILNTLQKQWGENGSRSILAGLFGKDSPWADPVKFAKTLGTPIDARDMSSLSRWMARASSAPYLLRTAAIVGLSGGSMYAMYQHPDRIPEIIGALAGLGLGAKLMGRMDLAGQRAYVNWRLNPGSPEAFKNFMRASGAMIGATSALPEDSSSPTPTP